MLLEERLDRALARGRQDRAISAALLQDREHLASVQMQVTPFDAPVVRFDEEGRELLPAPGREIEAEPLVVALRREIEEYAGASCVRFGQPLGPEHRIRDTHGVRMIV